MIDLTLPANDNAPNAQERWAHMDRLGSVVAMSDTSGEVLEQYRYSPYGVPGWEGPAGFPFRFTGQKLDPETGLYYYKARYYDPETGRFLQTDPIGYEDQMNLYAYVGNDPVNAIDPSGMCTGSRLTNSDGTCKSTGGFTTGSGGAAQGMIDKRIGQRVLNQIGGEASADSTRQLGRLIRTSVNSNSRRQGRNEEAKPPFDAPPKETQIAAGRASMNGPDTVQIPRNTYNAVRVYAYPLGKNMGYGKPLGPIGRRIPKASKPGIQVQIVQNGCGRRCIQADVTLRANPGSSASRTFRIPLVNQYFVRLAPVGSAPWDYTITGIR